MTSSAKPSSAPAPGSGRGCRIGIVAARWHADIIETLLEGALDTLAQAGVEQSDIITVRVPGSYEIPVAVRTLIDAQRVDAVITLGVVVRGETAHFEYVASPVAHALMNLSATTGVPCLFGVLTTESSEQAWDRAGGAHGHKGRESAEGALEMIAALRHIRSQLP